MKPTLTVTKDFTEDFKAIIKRFRNDKVLVGIPAEDTQRSDQKTNSPITNAALLAINNFGSPANNIPARPVMSIGIKRAQESIAEQFKLCAQNVLSKGLAALDIYYERAGIIASSSIKRTINEQFGIDPPAKSTIKARQSRGFKGNKALIVTGQMRNAITWIVQRGFR